MVELSLHRIDVETGRCGNGLRVGIVRKRQDVGSKQREAAHVLPAGKWVRLSKAGGKSERSTNSVELRGRHMDQHMLAFDSTYFEAIHRHPQQSTD